MAPIDFNELFNDSYEYIQQNSDAFYTQFYEDFISSSPLIQAQFIHTDLQQQKKMLKKSIDHTVGFFVSKKASTYLLDIAKKHQHLNITHEMFDFFMDALITALSKTYPHFTPQCALAWRITLSPAIELMKHIHQIADDHHIDKK